MPKTIYMVSADYGGMENWFEAAFVNESDRNEIALAVAEEVEHANFNLNVAAWIGSYPPGPRVEETAIHHALQMAKRWEHAKDLIATWEVPLYDGV